MGTSIKAGVENAEGELAWLRKVAERYPDAEQWRLPDGRSVWASRQVVPTDLMVVTVARADGEVEAYAVPFGLVGGYAVYRRTDWLHPVGILLMQMKGDQPALFAKVVAYTVRRDA